MNLPKPNKQRVALVGVLVAALGSLSAAARIGSVAQAPAASAQTSGLLMGRVVDAGDGRPIAGALVTLNPGAPGAPTPNSVIAAAPGQRAQPLVSPRQVLTDRDGTFVFDDLPKGSYVIVSSKPGYLEAAYGRRMPVSELARPPRQEIELAEGQRLSELRILQWQYGAISGVVTDEAGEPAIGVSVRAMRRTFAGGRAQFAVAGVDVTDDRGIYRIASLEPGDYIVVIPVTQSTVPVEFIERQTANGGPPDGVGLSNVGVSMTVVLRPGSRIGDFVVQSSSLAGRTAAMPVPPGGGRFLVYPTTFSAGARAASQAPVLHVGAGERITAALQLRPVPGVMVSGTATGPDGPVPFVGVRLVLAGDDSPFDSPVDAATTATAPDGTFTFFGVPAGSYALRAYRATGTGARGTGPYTSTLWGDSPIAIGNSDVTGVALTLRNGFRIRGRLEFDGQSARPTPDLLTAFAIAVERAGGGLAIGPGFGATFDASGQISTNELPPDRYCLHFIARTSAAQASKWVLKSAMSKGRDLSISAFMLQGDLDDIVFTLTDRPTETQGTVRDAQGRPDPDATVLVFPVDPAAWIDTGPSPRRLRSARVSETGRYTISSLPAGDYLAVAIDDAKTADWQDLKFLQALMPTAVRLSIGDSEKKNLDLKTTVLR